MPYTTLNTSVRNVALVANNTYPTMPVVYSHQNGSEPAEAYMTINILNVDQIGHHSTPALTRANEILDVRVAYEVMVQFSFFGSLEEMLHTILLKELITILLCLKNFLRTNLGL